MERIKARAYKALPKQYWKPFWAVVLSAVLIMAILWQVEIVSWNTDEFFEFPFYLFVVNKWVARDFWYLMMIPTWLLGGWGFYQLGARNMVAHINIATYRVIKKFRKIDGKTIDEWMELEKN